MKRIEEIDTSLYQLYFLTNLTDEVLLKVQTDNGLMEVDDYDTFSTDSGTLIAFGESHLFGYHNYYACHNSNIQHIQSLPYEDIIDLFDQELGEQITMYTFTNSVSIPSKESLGTSDTLPENFVRCDYNKYGALPFYPSKNKIAVTRVRNVLDISGVGHILCINTSNTENPNKTSQTANTGSRTLTGVIKTIYEWAIVNEEPFNNNEPISKKAKQFLQDIGIPQNVLNDVLDNQVDMRVSRYLKGEDRPYYSFDENTSTPESLKNFYRQRCRYKNLFSLKRNHPNGSSIPDSVIAAEISGIETKLYTTCVENNIYEFSFQSIEESLNNNLIDNDSKNKIRHIYSILKEFYNK